MGRVLIVSGHSPCFSYRFGAKSIVDLLFVRFFFLNWLFVYNHIAEFTKEEPSLNV